jgi:ribose transport system ATP-binding protein
MREADEIRSADGQGASASDVAALSARRVSKTFAGQRALDNVDLMLRRGEIHALLGANGSGKSTFIKILSGYHKPDPGADVRVGDLTLSFGSPRASEQAGLRFIHQDLGLIDGLTVAENLTLGPGGPRRLWVSDRGDAAHVQDVLTKYGLAISARTDVARLSAANRSMLAIVRAMMSGLEQGGVLVLDEPTASLPPDEVNMLFSLLRALKANNTAILFVTHRLQEVFELADRVSVLRSGRLVALAATNELDHEMLLEMILGHRLIPSHGQRAEVGAPMLDVMELAGEGVMGATFAAQRGEVLGITGLIGSGYETVLGLVFGAQRRLGGTVRVSDRPVPAGRPDLSIKNGMAFVPAERRRLGSFNGWTVRENLTIPALRTTRGWLGEKRERIEAQNWLRRLDVTPGHPEVTFANLSGGNQQKVVLARWLRSGAQVFLFDEPTIGVDAGAKQSIHHQLREVAAAGASVVISSSDTEELSEVCDRVLVFGEGIVKQSLQAPVTSDEIFAASLAMATAGPGG